MSDRVGENADMIDLWPNDDQPTYAIICNEIDGTAAGAASTVQRVLLTLGLAIGSLLIAPVTRAENEVDNQSANPITLAVYGDWPYSNSLLAAAPKLLGSINSDPKVRLVLHVGDIHSGSMPCTGAGLTPVPPTADPTWNLGIYNLFQQFRDPVIYTPGDNEWTDCHKTKEGSSGAPLNELASVRSLFFAEPGHTLGMRPMEVATQAKAFDSNFPSDAQFVENVMWKQSEVISVTLNVPGSNNDTLPWKGGTGAFLNEAARKQEVAERTAADLRWLRAAFAKAEEENAKGVLIGLQLTCGIRRRWRPAETA